MQLSTALILLLALTSVPRASTAPGTDPTRDPYQAQREAMVQEQIQGRGLTDPQLIRAFQKVPRHRFVSPELAHHAYEDRALDIGFGQTISSPYMVAVMVQAIQPRTGQKVLEVGTGSGYQAAILAELATQVYSIEILEPLSRIAQNTLNSLGYTHVHCRAGNGYLGWPEAAPFDAIVVDCSPDHIPQVLVNQLAVGGRMVIPVTHASGVQELVLIEKDEGGQLLRTHLMPEHTPTPTHPPHQDGGQTDNDG